jgi:hypothetical protein
VLYVVPPTSALDAVRRVLHSVADAAQPTSVAMLRYLVGHFSTAGARAVP